VVRFQSSGAFSFQAQASPAYLEPGSLAQAAPACARSDFNPPTQQQSRKNSNNQLINIDKTKLASPLLLLFKPSRPCAGLFVLKSGHINNKRKIHEHAAFHSRA
jgi:hypothetical protein